MKKVLMINFFFPPLGGGGIQRALNFIRFLPDFGWQPIVLTVKDWDYHAVNEPLPNLTDTIIFRARASCHYKMLYEWLYKFRLNKLAHFLRANEKNWMIPDPMICWLPSAYSLAKKIINQHRPDAILSTSPPNSSHLLALLLRKETNIPWLADFRDEWSDYQFIQRWPVVKPFHRALEKQVLCNADAVISVTPEITDTLSHKIGLNSAKFKTIYNGFDPRITRHSMPPTSTTGCLKLVHTGTLYNSRNASTLVDAIFDLIRKQLLDPDQIQLEFIGTPSNGSDNTPSIIKNHDRFLAHDETISRLIDADVAVLIQSGDGKTGIPGKAFEYLALNKPILALVPEKSRLKTFLNDFGVKYLCDYDDLLNIADTVLRLYNEWQQGSLAVNYDSTQLSKYNRRNLTRQLADQLHSATMN